MKYVTFLDYPTVEATGRSFEAKIKEKDKEIAKLSQDMANIRQQFEELKVATQGHMNNQIKESTSLEGVKLSDVLMEILYFFITKGVALYIPSLPSRTVTRTSVTSSSVIRNR